MSTFVCIVFVVGIFLAQASGHPDGDRHVAVEDGNVGIVGGHRILIERAPFMASLRIQSGRGTFHFCGASIIHEQFVLTAAHCIMPGRKYKVLLGTDNVYGNGELFDIEKINVHEKFNNNTYGYDYCVIKLKKPVAFSSKVAKINLADPGKLPKNTEFNVTGWGYTGPSKIVSPKLLQVQVPLIGRQKCKDLYSNKTKTVITPRMICAGNDGHDSCQGDSGGPLTLGDVQYGVTSFGVGCGGPIPGVYARVSSVKSWIEEKLV